LILKNKINVTFLVAISSKVCENVFIGWKCKLIKKGRNHEIIKKETTGNKTIASVLAID